MDALLCESDPSVAGTLKLSWVPVDPMLLVSISMREEGAGELLHEESDSSNISICNKKWVSISFISLSKAQIKIYI
jgi:hypothetical protein